MNGVCERQSFAGQILKYGFLSLGLILALAASSGMVRADLIQLKEAGELHGQITGEDHKGSSKMIRTLSGAVIELSRERIAFVTERPKLVDVYERKARLTPLTVDDQWELADWCRTSDLKSERQTHLWEILKLDPEHEKANYALGRTKRNGVWGTREEHMASMGMVKFRGRYVTPEELELLEKSAEDREIERQWYAKARMWYGWLAAGGTSQQKALSELKEVKDPLALKGFSKYFQYDANREYRKLAIDLFENIQHTGSTARLVEMAVSDADGYVRSLALDAIKRGRTDQAIPYLIHSLSSSANIVVRRSGAALGELGSEKAVPHLIAALVTVHRYQTEEAIPSYSVGIGGGNAGYASSTVLPPDIEVMLRTGQLPYGVSVYSDQKPMTRTVDVNVAQENQEVLDALVLLTGQNYGFNERTWQLWWKSQHP